MSENKEEFTYTSKELAFCDEYLIDMNATQAAIRAGYSEASARSIGSEIMQKPHIKVLIHKRMRERSERVKRTGDDVINDIYTLGKKAEEKGELPTALNALVWEGKAHGSFTEKVEHSGAIGGDVELLRRKAQQLLDEQSTQNLNKGSNDSYSNEQEK